jgi:hypothetical protein
VKIWRSTDGGKTWEPFEPKPRSLLGTMAFDPNTPWSDGFGNLYWDHNPEEEP